MRDPITRLGLLLMLAAAAIGAGAPVRAASAAPPTCPAYADFPNPAAIAATARGFNLPGWDRADLLERPQVGVLAALFRRGMTHVRLPVDDRRLRAYGSTIPNKAAYLDELIGEIAELRSLGYAVSVDLHPGGELAALYASDPDAALAAVTAIWTDIAGAVRLFGPEGVYAELFNEPPVPAALWPEHLRAIAAHVRRELPRHTLIVGPAGPQRFELLADMPPLPDPNVIYAFHYYDPFLFTHQGADWNGPDSILPLLRGLPFPASLDDRAMADVLRGLDAQASPQAARGLRDALAEPWSETTVGQAFARVANWSRVHDRPVLVNEFGVLAAQAPRAARLTWLASVAGAAEARCIGWTHWDYGDGFGLLDPLTARPDEGVIDALMPNKAENRPDTRSETGSGWVLRP